MRKVGANKSKYVIPADKFICRYCGQLHVIKSQAAKDCANKHSPK